MRFIGSKVNLLNDIEEIVDNNCLNVNSFCDIFSGTSTVARHFKKKFSIISNDILHFSYILQKATIENNRSPKFKKLKKKGIDEPLSYLNEVTPKIDELKNIPFFYNNYTPNHNHKRSYFSQENAIKIDFIRQIIEEWKNEKAITEPEYNYLLASLIEAVPFVSNIAGTYGAYLKHWDIRSNKKIELKPLEVFDNKKNNKSYNEDSKTIIKKIEGDVLYIDPPYNERQYLPNYHILETVSKYDNPQIYGKTGMRPYGDIKSKYCLKKEVLIEFEKLVKDAKFKYIILSYSSEGLMSEQQIKSVLIKYAVKNSYMLKKISYRRYKHIKGKVNHNLKEFLLFIKKRTNIND
jgi:adenine-specific DNA-methyltransferase